MHPIERLRHVARSSGADQRVLVGETAAGLRGMGIDPAGLVVACRRIVQRHPSSGPLWWLCSQLLTSPDPLATARRLAKLIDDDPTPDMLVAQLPVDATVCVIGWPDLAGEALLRRGDLTALAVDADGLGASFVRRLERAEVTAEVVEPAGLAAAVTAADVVLVEALAVGAGELLATRGSRAAAAVGYCGEVAVWAVVGRGRCLPEQVFAAVVERVGDVRVPWDAEHETVPLALAGSVVRPDGLTSIEDADLSAECPPAPELLRTAIS